MPLTPISPAGYAPAENDEEWLASLTAEQRELLAELHAEPSPEQLAKFKIGEKRKPRKARQTRAAQRIPASRASRCAVGATTHSTATPSNAPRPSLALVPAKHETSTRNSRPRSPQRQRALDLIGDPYLAAWSKTTKLQKWGMACEAAGNRGGLFFTLHFSPARAKELAGLADPLNVLRRSIEHQLKAAFGRALPFNIKLELAGRLHAHGVAILPHDTQGERDKLILAMRKAGCFIKGRAGSTQCVPTPITDGLGLIGYLDKSHGETAEHVGTEKIIFTWRQLLDLAREDHAKHGPQKQRDKSEITDHEVSDKDLLNSIVKPASMIHRLPANKKKGGASSAFERDLHSNRSIRRLSGRAGGSRAARATARRRPLERDPARLGGMRRHRPGYSARGGPPGRMTFAAPL